MQKVWQYLLKILRGMVIGAANAIPGVSGGTMMVTMGIYDDIINSINSIFKKFKKSILTLLPYLIGMLVALVALASLFKTLFAHYPLPTNTLFIGLILGGLPIILKRIDKKQVNATAIIAFLLLFALVIVQAVCKSESTQTFQMNVGQFLLLIGIGMIASGTMIIPGVSGSMVLKTLGYYNWVYTDSLSALKDAVFAGNWAGCVQPLLVLLPFALGVVLGIVLMAKLIRFLLDRFPTITFCGVLGLVLASPIAILLEDGVMSDLSIGNILLSLLTFAVGFVAAVLLSRGEEAPAIDAPAAPSQDAPKQE